MNDLINTYRTKFFIVEQTISLFVSDTNDSMFISKEKYFLRNPKRDVAYEKTFKNSKNLNGKRIHTSMYSREYNY